MPQIDITTFYLTLEFYLETIIILGILMILMQKFTIFIAKYESFNIKEHIETFLS
jgi:hypothetical protein